MSTSNKRIFHAYLLIVLKMAHRCTIHSYKGKELQKSEEKRGLKIGKGVTSVRRFPIFKTRFFPIVAIISPCMREWYIYVPFLKDLTNMHEIYVCLIYS